MRSVGAKSVAKRVLVAVALACAAMLCLVACSSQQSAGTSSSSDTGKTLVVCFSATGNTQAVAQEAADALGADYFEIQPVDPYTSDDLGYTGSGERATNEQNSGTDRPAIANSVSNMDEYNTIVLCHPIWYSKAPRIICTFLESYDFSGKTIAELCTSEQSGIEDAQAELEQICPQATWLAGRRFAPGATQDEVTAWLKEIELM